MLSVSFHSVGSFMAYSVITQHNIQLSNCSGNHKRCFEFTKYTPISDHFDVFFVGLIMSLCAILLINQVPFTLFILKLQDTRRIRSMLWLLLTWWQKELVLSSHHCGYVRYHKTSNIAHTSVRNKIVDHSDEVGASPVDAALTTSPFTT